MSASSPTTTSTAATTALMSKTSDHVPAQNSNATTAVASVSPQPIPAPARKVEVKQPESSNDKIASEPDTVQCRFHHVLLNYAAWLLMCCSLIPFTDVREVPLCPAATETGAKANADRFVGQHNPLSYGLSTVKCSLASTKCMITNSLRSSPFSGYLTETTWKADGCCGCGRFNHQQRRGIISFVDRQDF
jgi:hypothetical protein